MNTPSLQKDGVDEESLRLRLDGTLDDATRIEVIKQIELDNSWKVEKELSDLRRPLRSVDPETLSVIKLAVAVAAFAYTLLKDRKTGATWTEQKLRDHLATELVAKGIVGFKIVDVNNFDAFRAGEELCVVKGHDKKGRSYKVWLFLDGEIAVLKIALDPEAA